MVRHQDQRSIPTIPVGKPASSATPMTMWPPAVFSEGRHVFQNSFLSESAAPVKLLLVDRRHTFAEAADSHTRFCRSCSTRFSKSLRVRAIGIPDLLACGILPLPICFPMAISGKHWLDNRRRNARFCWSERRDLNSGPPVPQTGALTGLRYAPPICANIYDGCLRGARADVSSRRPRESGDP